MSAIRCVFGALIDEISAASIAIMTEINKNNNTVVKQTWAIGRLSMKTRCYVGKR